MIELQKSNGMSEKINKNITKSASNFAPYLVDHQVLPDMNSNGYFVIKNNMSIPKKVINLYISYTLGPQSKIQTQNLHQVIAYLDL